MNNVSQSFVTQPEKQQQSKVAEELQHEFTNFINSNDKL